MIETLFREGIAAPAELGEQQGVQDDQHHACNERNEGFQQQVSEAAEAPYLDQVIADVVYQDQHGGIGKKRYPAHIPDAGRQVGIIGQTLGQQRCQHTVPHYRDEQAYGRMQPSRIHKYIYRESRTEAEQQHSPGGSGQGQQQDDQRVEKRTVGRQSPGAAEPLQMYVIQEEYLNEHDGYKS